MDGKVKEALDELTGAVKAVGERQVSLEDRIKTVEETPSTDSSEKPGGEEEKEKGKETSLTDSSESTARLQELEAENLRLCQQAESYEDPAYTSEIIREGISQWARGLTPENYIALGVKLGFQDVLAEEEGQDPDLLGDVNLDGGPRVMFREAVPAGETGWLESKSLGCFVKVEH